MYLDFTDRNQETKNSASHTSVIHDLTCYCFVAIETSLVLPLLMMAMIL